MKEHTPGPWHAHHDHGWLVVESDDGDLYIKIEKGSAATSRIADARLIAAAPDLLEALKDCAAVCAGETMSKQGLVNALEKSRSAIAKATGEST